MLRPVPWLEEVAVLPIRKVFRPLRESRPRSRAPTFGACAVSSGGGAPIRVESRIASSFKAEASLAAAILSSEISSHPCNHPSQDNRLRIFPRIPAEAVRIVDAADL